ncbi:N-acetylglucosaminyl-phosphatidylinositol de-N-acetylase [Thecaphora frezii]
MSLPCLDGWAFRRLRRAALRRPLSSLTLLALASLLVLQGFLSGLTTSLHWHPSPHSGERAMLPRSVLVLTAHPDDEVMFFAPSILALAGAGVQIFSLCLSTGNADGLGAVRARELIDAYSMLGVPGDRVTALEDEKLQDGMATYWDPDYISDKVEHHLAGLGQGIEALITFDAVGVSSHANHKACYQASLRLRDRGTVEAVYTLQSPSLAAKYLSLPLATLEALLSLPCSGRTAALSTEVESVVDRLPVSICTLSSPWAYGRSVAAMRQHTSQLVWFRYFYIALSKLMYGNLLVRL